MKYRLVITDTKGTKTIVERVGRKAINDVRRLVDESDMFTEWVLYEVTTRYLTGLEDVPIEREIILEASENWLPF